MTLQELYQQCEELHARLQGELSHWSALCEQYGNICTAMHARKKSMDAVCDEGTAAMRALREYVERQDDPSDWWKSGPHEE